MEPAVYTPSKPVPTEPVSFEEFIEWLDEDTHAEWVDGKVILKMPVSVKHQDENRYLLKLLSAWLEDYHSFGEVYHPPLQVKLDLLSGARRSREPDIVVILNDRLSQLTEQYFDGAPNLIVEILSPTTRAVDRSEKFAEYEAACVPEYWIIDPDREYAEFWQLEEIGAYRAAFCGERRRLSQSRAAGLLAARGVALEAASLARSAARVGTALRHGSGITSTA
ncbi:MAG: Uma2 family endonuclease [Fimbriimonadales bacterium]|nr:Uma2 family endonuclease [Fimbriimonadales bacterium]